MRGKVDFEVFEYDWLGITPAYAGKSTCLYNDLDDLQDHPRLCGEKSS